MEQAQDDVHCNSSRSKGASLHNRCELLWRSCGGEKSMSLRFASAIVLVVVLWLSCSVLDGCDAAWIDPVTLGPSDRIAFVRPRKTGSTSTVMFFRKAGWCENHCVPGTGECVDCLYSWNCTRCPELKTTYKQCLECNHQSLPRLRTKFAKVQSHILDQGGFLGHMYTVMLLRDPVERVMSFFFYVRSACPFRGSKERAEKAHRKLIPLPWLVGRPEEEQEAVCTGDMERFLRMTPAHNEQADLLVGIGYFQPNVSEQQCSNALLRLQELHAVILTGEMKDSLRMLEQTFKRPPEFHLPPARQKGLFEGHARTTIQDPLRKRLESNATITRLIQEYNHCDVRLYERARELFAEGRRRLLGRG